MFLKHLKKQHAKSSIFALLITLYTSSILSEGFLAGTLVKTNQAFKKIEQLSLEDKLVTYKFKSKDLDVKKIEQITKKKFNRFYKLTIDGKETLAAPDQKFFCPLRKGAWIKAKDIQKNDFIIRDLDKLIRVEEIMELQQEADFYSLSIRDNHNFFVSENNVLVHNEPISITLGTIGSFKVCFNIAAPAIVAIGVWLNKKIFGKKNDDSTAMKAPAGMSDADYYKMVHERIKEEAKKLKDRGLGDWEIDTDKQNKEHPDELIFINKERNDWISPEIDEQIGSTWKRVNRKGEKIESLDNNLKVISKNHI